MVINNFFTNSQFNLNLLILERFILCNDFLTKNYFPKYLELFSTKILKRIWFWKFDAVPFWKVCTCNKKIKEENLKNSEIYKIYNLYVSRNTKAYELSNLNGPNKNFSEISPETTSKLPEKGAKCQLCDFCEKCEKDKQKDKEKKKTKEFNESNISALNHFACVILIIIEFTCNLTVWLLVSDPPNGY